MRILVVDDDPAVRRSLEHALGRDGYDVASAADGASALAEHGVFRPDAVVLDVLMPEPNGLEVCRTLRSGGYDTPILMLTARDLDLSGRRAERAGRRLELTKTELSLLELFLRNPRRVLSRTQIFESVWGYDFGPESNALWVYISYLRSKLEADGGSRLIQTVRGLGYVLREEP